jgi:hypothetical protein
MPMILLRTATNIPCQQTMQAADISLVGRTYLKGEKLVAQGGMYRTCLFDGS